MKRSLLYAIGAYVLIALVLKWRAQDWVTWSFALAWGIKPVDTLAAIYTDLSQGSPFSTKQFADLDPSMQGNI